MDTSARQGDIDRDRNIGASSSSAEHVLERVGRLPAVSTIGIAAALTVLVFVLDFVTGSEISFSIFYVLPVAVIALRFGNAPGLSASVAAAAAWFVSETLSDDDTSTLVPFWNGLVRLGFFAMIAVLIVAVRDLLRERRDEGRLDALTGVSNGRGFRELADRELARARRSGRPLSVGYLDLDRFKQLNDSAGHSAGDAALQELGRAMRASVRTVDVVGRLGGDEFALLLPETDQAQARILVGRLRHALRPVCDEYEVDTSIGVVTFTTVPATVDDALRRADALMYDVKANGRGAARFELHPCVSPSEVVGGDEAPVDVQQ